LGGGGAPESRNVGQVKRNGWSPSDLVDWLLDCDIHWIVCHPHQGLRSYGGA
jgi:hypothetical protein